MKKISVITSFVVLSLFGIVLLFNTTGYSSGIKPGLCNCPSQTAEVFKVPYFINDGTTGIKQFVGCLSQEEIDALPPTYIENQISWSYELGCSNIVNGGIIIP